MVNNRLYQPTLEDLTGKTVCQTNIEGLFFVPHSHHPDERGFYGEMSRIPEIEAAVGQSFAIKQLNHSHSVSNVIRGFHAENWNKLISIISGVCFCAFADFRPDSPTFKTVQYVQLGYGPGALNGSMFISSGIGNSFCVLEGPADYLYAVDQLYTERDPSGDLAISLFDPDLAVEWPIPREQMIISDRDRQAITLQEKFGS